MDRFNLSKMGINVDFLPVVDSSLKIIAYEAAISLEGDNPNQDVFQFHSSELNEVQASIDLYYKKKALETYNRSSPLLLSTYPNVSDPYPSSLPHPKGFEVILTVNPPELWLNGFVMGRYDQLSSQGVSFALADFGQSFLSLPFLLHLRPTIIKLADNVIQSCMIDDEILKTVSNLMKPYREMGIKILAGGINSRVQFERMTLVADAFQGYWFSKLGGEPTIL
ncbi:EAL domain-containing protein [Cohnella massiliensis]|uniref:EAL domain-containing protein n=1 Tax=Cohnella massiliensis TaxID=1816691 RepID=UPI0009BA09EA|nr:EAL domain-containing protein [Cohnella massiliensis]